MVENIMTGVCKRRFSKPKKELGNLSPQFPASEMNMFQLSKI